MFFSHNSKTIEFVTPIHAKINRALVGGPTYVISSLIDWLINRLLYMIDLLHSNTCMRLFCACLLTFVFHEANQLITQVHSLPLLFFRLLCFN